MVVCMHKPSWIVEDKDIIEAAKLKIFALYLLQKLTDSLFKRETNSMLHDFFFYYKHNKYLVEYFLNVLKIII